MKRFFQQWATRSRATSSPPPSSEAAGLQTQALPRSPDDESDALWQPQDSAESLVGSDDLAVHRLPQSIGRYRVLQRLGQGATAEVFLAEDTFNRRSVAIKRMLTLQEGATEDDPNYIRRFFASEAALVGRLNHPNIVQIFEADAQAQPPYLVMEYVPGGTLREFCSNDHLLPLDQIIDVAFKCAQALDHVYRQGVVHRDIKPANILYMHNSLSGLDVKISDFGSAFNFQADQTQIFRVGSLAYMPPEQLDGHTLDHTADQYALSAVLYHLISGRAPFETPNHGTLVHHIYSVKPQPLAQHRQQLPQALCDLVERGLAKQPNQRWPSWESYAQILADLLQDGSVRSASQQQVLDSERFALLRQLEFFHNFNDVQLWEVARRADWRRFAAGDHLFKPGQVGGHFFILAQGRVQVFRESNLVADLGAGTSVGEMAYLAPSPELRLHSALVQASEPTTALSLSVESMEQFSPETLHRFDAAFIQVLVRRLHAAHESLAHPRQILPTASDVKSKQIR